MLPNIHVRHALRLLPDHGTLAVLLRTVWINAIGRADLLPHVHLEVIAGRLKMLPPGARDRGHNGTTDFAWFIMRREIVEAMRLVQGQAPGRRRRATRCTRTPRMIPPPDVRPQ